ncbi:orotate phosphoribosyltransferase [uncultured Tateyamaria sp.]|uniref:orotate phosphoribosyltransferase n=1 Tax=uncultured Tateyamaria sp. TaxID=455651 RepID=UPI0026072507|nr:orotate phosphoribosyltransferase [uncultured Tateyamaria sp.]
MSEQSTTSLQELAKGITAVSRLEGTFVLRSGQTSNHYFDKYRFEGQPSLIAPLAKEMCKLLPSDTEIVAGLELGGVPLATVISLQTGLPTAFVRKTAKTYGTCRAIEGQEFAGKKVTFIEDIISTGGAVADAHGLATEAGATILGVVCAIWRGDDTPQVKAVPHLPVYPVFTSDQLEP